MKLRLVPEQIQLLKEEFLKVNKDKNSVLADRMINSDEIKASDEGKGFSFSSATYQEETEFIQLTSRQREIAKIIENSLVVSEYHEDYIDLGTVFEISFLDDEEPEIYTLVEKRVSTESSSGNNRFISLDSPIGRSVYGKRESEPFACVIPGGDLCAGVITKVYSEEKAKAYRKQNIKVQEKKI